MAKAKFKRGKCRILYGTGNFVDVDALILDSKKYPGVFALTPDTNYRNGAAKSTPAKRVVTHIPTGLSCGLMQTHHKARLLAVALASIDFEWNDSTLGTKILNPKLGNEMKLIRGLIAMHGDQWRTAYVAERLIKGGLDNAVKTPLQDNKAD